MGPFFCRTVFALADQIYAIEALGRSRNRAALEYLRSLCSTDTVNVVEYRERLNDESPPWGTPGWSWREKHFYPKAKGELWNLLHTDSTGAEDWADYQNRIEELSKGAHRTPRTSTGGREPVPIYSVWSGTGPLPTAGEALRVHKLILESIARLQPDVGEEGGPTTGLSGRGTQPPRRSA